MLGAILKSKIATQTTIAIIEAFAKLRELSRNIEAIHQEQDHIKQKGLIKRTGDNDVTQTESTVELNLMAIKFRHTVKRTMKRNEPGQNDTLKRQSRNEYLCTNILTV